MNSPGDLSSDLSPGNFPPVISPDLESILERMKRLDFSKPVTPRLTPGSNDYTNPNTNPENGRFLKRSWIDELEHC